ncbi:MAG: hypothetical protein H6642_09615 [Caldilineaceae bacterium]|nr:hypothetical protein [Caldilineaceae bacterium]
MLMRTADICRVDLCVPLVTEAACLGAFLLAGVGAGVYADVETGVACAVRNGDVFRPDATRMDAYDVRYELFSGIYPLLRSFHHRLSAI